MKNGMSVWRDTFSPIHDFRREFDRLFDDWSGSSVRSSSQNEQSYVPVCDIEEAEGHYLLSLEIPGVKKENIKLEVIDNQIVVSGERRSETVKNDAGLTYSERRSGRFNRVFGLPPGIDSGKVEAKYQDGILQIIVPKAESAKPRQIKIASDAKESKFFGKFLGQQNEEEKLHSPSGERVAS